MGGSKSSTVGYFYYKDLQGVLCQTPVNSVTRIECSDREIYRSGIDENQIVEIKKDNVFGGKDREGGISGKMEFLFGGENQEPSVYMSSKLNSYVPASRGVLSVVFQNLYVGMNPYFRDFKYRIRTSKTGWYDAKAEINVSDKPSDFVYGAWSSKFTENGNILSINNTINITRTSASGRIEFSVDHTSSSDFYIETVQPNYIITRQLESLSITSTGDISVIERDYAGSYWEKVYEIKVKAKSGRNKNTKVYFDYIKKSNFVNFEMQVYIKNPKPTDGYLSVGYYDADLNAAHIIRLCLTNKIWGLGFDSSKIDDLAFKKCADKIFDEGLGISIVWAQTTSVWQFMREICDHVQAVMPHEDVNTGLWTWALLRDDYNVNSLLHLNESNIEQIKEYKRKTMSDMINVVTVSYTDRDQGKISSVTIDNPARVAQQGRAIESKVEYLGFTNSEVAGRVALRDLKTLSKELATITFTALSAVKNLKIGDCFTWSWNDFGISRAVMRVQSIKRAGILSSKYIITAVEDSFSTPMESVIPYVPPTPNPNNQKAEPSKTVAIEAPYFEIVQQIGQSAIDTQLQNDGDIGFILAGASTDQNAINAVLLTSTSDDFADVGIIDFCEYAKNTLELNHTVSSFVVDRIVDVNAETYFKINDELMSVISFNSTTKTLTVKRGVLDTQVQEHIANSELWFIDENNGFDEQTYFNGQTVNTKALTNTGNDVLDESEAVNNPVAIHARAFRPYPPQNVKINNQYFPNDVTGALSIAWSSRNRISQTSGTFVSWFDDSLIVESGVTYRYETVNSTDVVLSSGSGIINTEINLDVADYYPSAKLRLWSCRDGFDCLRPSEIMLVSTIGELSSFIEPIYAKGEFVRLTAKLSNGSPLTRVSLVSGSLPVGWSLSGIVISGTATTDSTYNFKIEVEDEFRNIIQKDFTVKVQGQSWSQLKFDNQDMTDLVGNVWAAQGNGNTFTDGFDAGYALKMGGIAASILNKSMTQTTSLSMSCDIRITKIAVDYIPILYLGSATSNTQRDCVYVVSDGGVNKIRHYRQAGTSTSASFDSSEVPMNEWMHVAYEISGNSLKLYINRKLVATGTYTYAIASFAAFYIGLARANSAAVYRDGIDIDNVLVTTGASRFG